jgi:hypothetical protein
MHLCFAVFAFGLCKNLPCWLAVEVAFISLLALVFIVCIVSSKR